MGKFKFTEAQERWLQALESGNYKRGTGVLRNNDKFCCLGVACDVSKVGEWEEPQNTDSVYTYKVMCHPAATGILPRDVQDELNMEHLDGQFVGKKPNDKFHSLVQMNDWGVPHKKIAEFIRKNPSRVFRMEANDADS